MELQHHHEYTDACAHADMMNERLNVLEDHCFPPVTVDDVIAEPVVVTEELPPAEPVEVNVEVDVHVEEESSHEEASSHEEESSHEESGDEDEEGEDPDGEVVITDDSGLPELSSSEKSDETHRLPMMRS